MPRYETGDITSLGCVLSLKAVGEYEGELGIEDLEEIDDVMVNIGSQRTGQRVNVDSTRVNRAVRVEYVYQESILSKSFEHAVDRLEMMTELENPYIVADTTTVEFRDVGGRT